MYTYIQNLHTYVYYWYITIPKENNFYAVYDRPCTCIFGITIFSFIILLTIFLLFFGHFSLQVVILCTSSTWWIISCEIADKCNVNNSLSITIDGVMLYTVSSVDTTVKVHSRRSVNTDITILHCVHCVLRGVRQIRPIRQSNEK